MYAQRSGFLFAPNNVPTSTTVVELHERHEVRTQRAYLIRERASGRLWLLAWEDHLFAQGVDVFVGVVEVEQPPRVLRWLNL